MYTEDHLEKITSLDSSFAEGVVDTGTNLSYFSSTFSLRLRVQSRDSPVPLPLSTFVSADNFNELTAVLVLSAINPPHHSTSFTSL